MAYQPGSRRSCPLSFSHWRARVRTYLPLVTLRVTSVMTSWPRLTERRSSNRFSLRGRRASADTRRMCGEGGNGKLEEALRPVFDLPCFSFSQQFDPEMRPLSFLQALSDCPGKGYYRGQSRDHYTDTCGLHPFDFSSLCLLFSCEPARLSFWPSQMKSNLILNCCKGAFDMSLTRLECSASYRSELS